MLRPFCLLTVGSLLACASETTVVDDGMRDAPRLEGLSFVDMEPDAGQPDDAPRGETGPLDHGPADAPDPDARPPDTRPPDLSPPCSAYSQFTCTSNGGTCTASCFAGTAVLSISCASNTCVCARNGGPLRSCMVAGTDCAACEEAFPCCASVF